MRSFAIGIGIMLFSAGAAAAQASQTCVQLERQLASLDQNSVSPQQIRRAEENVARQRYELDRTIAYSRSLGCGRTFLFGPAPSPECRGIDARIDQQRNNLDQLMVQAQRARAGDPNRDVRRNQILAALGQNQCGPQYANAPQQPRRGGIFGLLFGGGAQEEIIEPTVPYSDDSRPNNDSFRTVCVRMCDGFFYPISYSTTPSNFARDAAICQQTCPGTQADLFTYPNPGGDMHQAANMNAESYTNLENAFRYQKEFVKDCSCKPAGQTWAQALSNGQDPTIREGDIVIDEDRAREMSAPKKPDQPQQSQP
ncbi:hypothetical protein GCM10007276_13790 [Agaricicola taiwanensis]|uniref:DUF2865 domain-containing protein n=1 Tax=Agaricicola taiwanensis TaxID=591372 RepID=A0A8J2VRF4_9RHOB|nr:DUF2865 domain-containing protein [Agaricicola taiwanensis]GGE37605.1 hypothetical protein GCM10007276_13790 [Agaricicola taiwanensis]